MFFKIDFNYKIVGSGDTTGDKISNEFKAFSSYVIQKLMEYFHKHIKLQYRYKMPQRFFFFQHHLIYSDFVTY